MRRLPIIVLTCLLSASGWSPVLAAAFCPRGKGHDCCASESAKDKHDHAAHHEGMEMGGAEAPRPAHTNESHEGTSAAALDHPVKDCSHCAAHSGGPKTPAITFGVTMSSGSDAASAPPQVGQLLFRASPSPNLLVSSRPHAPPTGASPRHVLLSVFLI
ncbi:MAG: hypothetical protein JOZ02_18575 [Acidobacteria bacterium]|nr:hypothetical protein [Acidobacteriota bacterium]